MAPHLHHFDPGLSGELSNISERQEANSSTALLQLSRSLEIEQAANVLTSLSRESFTLESLQLNNATTSNDKSQSSRKRTRDTESSATSAPGSTSKGRACVPFWSPRVGELSRKLLSSTATAWHDSPLISWSSFSKNKASNSWFTVKAQVPNPPNSSPETLWQSQLSLWQVITENEQRKEDVDVSAKEKKKRKLDNSKAKKVYKLARTKKVRIRPDQSQRSTFNTWFNHARRAYNIFIAVQKEIEEGNEETIRDVNRIASFPALSPKKRPIITIKDGKLFIPARGRDAAIDMVVATRERCGDVSKMPCGPQPPKPEWLTTPVEIREKAYKDAKDAVAAAKANNRERGVRGEEAIKSTFKFRSRRDKAKSISVKARTYNQKSGVIPDLLRACNVRKNTKLPEKTTGAVRIGMDRERKVTLYFVEEREVKSEELAPDSFHSVASLDPGTRTFQSIFDADGNAIEWGAGDETQIMYHCRRADNLQSKIAKQKDKHKRWYLKRAYYRTHRKLKDKVKECHRKLALFLCENYRVVLIPKFDVSRMVKKANRKINKKTVRSMYTWSHFSFRQSLLEKAKEHPWCRVVEVDEAYTSVTCDECGFIRPSFSGKTFVCPKCHHVADRDIHAGKNILLRYLAREGLIS